MQAYRPYLLPLLDERLRASIAPGGVTSPLEEESRIRTALPPHERTWPELAAAVRRTCGLPLLLDTHAERVAQRPGQSPDNLCPARYLVLREGDREWFLLEHPDALVHFDRFGKAGQEAALARPSLFAELWRASDPAGGLAEDDPPPRVAESGESNALTYHLDRLLARDHPSDWHLEPERDHFRSRLRVDGVLGREERLPVEKGRWLVQSMLALAGLDHGMEDQPQEGRATCRNGRGEPVLLRLSLIPSLYGQAMVVRFLYPESAGRRSLEALGFNRPLRQRLENLHADGEGLWLLAGPTGSGKTTTLHALLRLSVQRGEKTLAIEDPVEVTLDGVQHLSVGSPPGLTYARAMRAFLRQAPDCVLIGEIRDEETAALALQAARTGHRILSTLHARDNPGVLRRFADLGQNPAALEALQPLVLHQRLLPLLCPACRHNAPLPGDWAGLPDRLHLPMPGQHAVAAGCSRCQSGLRGRTAVVSSGIFSTTGNVDAELLACAWPLVCQGKIPLEALVPFLPAGIREGFTVCLGQGFC
jgi:Tfp pilus assembly pilus retraction ATPase PilT